MPDVDPSRSKEEIHAEMRIKDLVFAKDRKDRFFRNRAKKLPKQESANDCRRCRPWSGTKCGAGQMNYGLQNLPPIPSACNDRTRLSRDLGELLQQVSWDRFCVVREREEINKPFGEARRMNTI